MKNLNLFVFLSACVFAFGISEIKAQQLPLSNQYVINKFSLSPSYAGATDYSGVFGSYRRDWVGIEGTPETKVISGNTAIGKNMGVGGSLSSLQAGIFTNLSAMIYFAYHVKFSETSTLGIGLGVGMLENHLDLSKNNESVFDPVLLNTNTTTAMPDASIGITFRHKNLYLGFSAPRLIGVNRPAYKLWPQQLAHIGYTYNINSIWSIDPIAIVYIPKDAPLYFDVTVPVIYQKKIWLTLGMKKMSSAVGLGLCLKSNLLFNYTFEMSKESGFGKGSGGTHEITLGWKFNKNSSDRIKKDKKKPYLNWVN